MATVVKRKDLEDEIRRLDMDIRDQRRKMAEARGPRRNIRLRENDRDGDDRPTKRRVVVRRRDELERERTQTYSSLSRFAEREDRGRERRERGKEKEKEKVKEREFEREGEREKPTDEGVVNTEAGELVEGKEGGEKPTETIAAKRARLTSQIPARSVELMKRDVNIAARSKKMFAGLLGHLGQAKSRLQSEQTSDQIKRKQEAEEKVARKVVVESQELRETHLQEVNKRREEERARLQKLEEDRREKELALLDLVVSEHEKALGRYIKTRAGPHLMYLPAKHNDRTRKLLEESHLVVLQRVARGNFIVRAESESAESEKPTSTLSSAVVVDPATAAAEQKEGTSAAAAEEAPQPVSTEESTDASSDAAATAAPSSESATATATATTASTDAATEEGQQKKESRRSRSKSPAGSESDSSSSSDSDRD